jgi:hypothetical protein
VITDYAAELDAVNALTPESPAEEWKACIETQLTKVRDAYDYARDERDEVLAWIAAYQDTVKDSEINRLLDEADAAVRDIPDEYV